MNTEPTRRGILQAFGAAATIGILPRTGTARATETNDDAWTVVEPPTSEHLHGMAETDTRIYAVGGNGVVIVRRSGDWSVLVDDASNGDGNDLSSVALTEDGSHVWVAGESGTLAKYDVETGTLVDHSEPAGVTEDFLALAVTGPAGDSSVFVADDAGQVHSSFRSGSPDTWQATTPGDGTSLHAINFYDDRRGHVADGAGSVYATSSGRSWQKLGVPNADHPLYAVDSFGRKDLVIGGAEGRIYYLRTDDPGAGGRDQWLDDDLGHTAVYDIRVENRSRDSPGLAVGSKGAVYRRPSERWIEEPTPTQRDLSAVTRVPDVAVGDHGTILEH